MKAEAKKLIEMVRKGLPDKEIMKQLGIQTKVSLKKMYYDALVEAGKIKDILTERELKKAAPRRRALTIGKRGTLLHRFSVKKGGLFKRGKGSHLHLSFRTFLMIVSTREFSLRYFRARFTAVVTA